MLEKIFIIFWAGCVIAGFTSGFVAIVFFDLEFYYFIERLLLSLIIVTSFSGIIGLCYTIFREIIEI